MKYKEPKKHTLAEVLALADKQFPPPWSIIESVGRLEAYVLSYQANQKRQERRTG